ncbi:cation-translocating P-type ATPase [Williamsoniiplasma lucivorax]|uniref:Cation-transporting ATPase n=1 Tax=Williamsoniiplasma lucivorax TaxID=209274 RepID=A0A2S5RCX2_9MOLU|nr:HAD-IC family P-type ATPase [Williamsoniiplasma lucivorax]PPE05176.1 cation-transporting ATPase [Williamsoniiplasma lucivorax]
MENFENSNLTEIESKLNTDYKKGLTEDEVNQRLKTGGKNVLPTKKPTPWYVVFGWSLIEPLQIILMVAAVISVIAPRFGRWSDSITFEEFIDFIVIALIVLLDAVLQTVQTVKARKSVDALKSLSKPQAVVIRDGSQKEIDAENLVVGDIVVLEAGKYVPAELRIIESSDLMVDESILTGESLPVEKTHEKQKVTTILAEMANVVFMSTFTTAGRAIGVVTKTGVNTEIGKISTTINENADQETPLEKKLKKFSYLISVVAVIIGVIIFGAMLVTGQKDSWATYLIIAITLAIGVIPESLSAVVSITLSFSTKRMVKENVIVKKLASVETLGSVNVICTDKTGTLTQNKMTVKRMIWNNKIITDEEFIATTLDEHKDFMLKGLVLPNDSVVEDDARMGDPTELALVDFALKMGVDETLSRNTWQRMDEIPFDSERKLMTTVNNVNGDNIIFTKGAIDQLLNVTSRILIDNQIQTLTAAMKKEILNNATKLSDQALRVLAFAYNDGYDDLDNQDDLEQNLIFIGAVGMIDPVRQEAVQAIAEAYNAGIRVVMITGDHATTALAIARDLNLAYTEYEVMSSDVLESLSDVDLLRIIDNIKVFARVNPEHKVRIVNLLQQKGNIVSMTGDGVNDAPSLAKAEIGVAMGIAGTDVAKQAADVILTDDNFGTIMKGVNEGRNVFQKIRRSIVLLMGFNFANVLTILILSLINHTAPLDAVDILYVNLVVESCLAIAIGMGNLDPTLMKLPPKQGGSGLLAGLLIPILKIMIISTIISLISFYVGMAFTPSEFVSHISGDTDKWWVVINDNIYSVEQKTEVIIYGRTSLFITIVFAPLFFSHFIKLSNWKASNKIDWKISTPLVYAALIAFVLNLAFIFIPGLNDQIFKLLGYENLDCDKFGWNQNNLGLFFAAFGLAILPACGILLWDAITFYAYHWSHEAWQRNRKIVSKMVEEDKKIALAKSKKNRKKI